MTIVINVPDRNDSFSKVTLERTQYLVRFTYNDTKDYWTFGLYDLERRPLWIGVRLVPNFPLRYFNQSRRLPAGDFGVISDQPKVGRQDFVSGSARFVFLPWADLEGEPT